MAKYHLIYCVLLICFACRPARQAAIIPPGPPATVQSDSSKTAPMPQQVSNARTDAFMETILAADPQFRDMLDRRQDLKVQVIYTQIDRKAHNKPVFTPYFFNVDAQAYFYPASMVKMPVALLSLEKLQELALPALTKETAMLTGAAFSGQTQVLNDPTTPDGVPSIGQYIKKVFLVSDNDAFNRLYEFMGQSAINKKLSSKGYSTANIYHRLSLALTEAENRHTNPIKFLDSLGNLVYEQPMVNSEWPYSHRNDAVGKAYLNGGSLVNQPLDFSGKNRFGLEDLTKVLRAIMFPESLPEAERFRISKDDYRFVRKYMSELPGESQSPEYPKPDYWPTYCKFLYYGSDSTVVPDTAHLRIFNKVGDAYGFLTDVAYIVDFEKGIEFMLSATIYCNSDGILNDDKYDYDTIGYPFMKNIGRLFYDYDLKRERKNKPDLSEFKLDYDKR